MVLRELFLALGLDVDEASFAKGQFAAGLLQSVLEKVVDTGKELVHKFFEIIQETAHTAHRFEELAQITGIEVDALQNLTSAAELAGSSTEAVSTGIGFLARNMRAAKEGSEEAAKVFRKLGIHVKEADGKLRGADDVLLDLADKFESMPDGAEKAALSMQFFGRAGKELIPFLNKGRDGIAALAKETPNLTEEQIQAGSELILTQKRLHAQTAALWQQAIGPLLPAITDLLKRLLQWKKENAAILSQNITKYIGYAISAVRILGSTFQFLIDNGKMVKVILGGMVVAFVAVNAAAVAAAIASAAAWATALAPFLAISAALTAIMLVFDDFRVFQEGGKSVIGDAMAGLEKFLEDKWGDSPFVLMLKDIGRWLLDVAKEMDVFDLKADSVWKTLFKFVTFVPRTIGGAVGDAAGETRVNAADAYYTASNPNAASSDSAFRGAPGTPEYRKTMHSAPAIEDWKPEYRALLPPGGGVLRNGPTVNIGPVTQLPGEKGEEFAQRVGAVISKYWDAKVDEAHAVVE